MNYSKIQKQILQKLLTKYESSKTYKGQNSVNQNFSIKPTDVFKDYEKDSADINTIDDFEKQCKYLENENLIHLNWKYDRISRITAYDNPENWEKYRNILEVKDKNTRLKEEIEYYSKYINTNQIITELAKEQIERLNLGKEAKYERTEAEKIFNLLLFILNNKEEILERELSISVLHDSKLWEKKYKSKICKLLKEKINTFDLIQNADEKEANKIILEQYNIFDNPTYVYFKGKANIHFSDGSLITISQENPIALSSVSLKNITKLEIINTQIITIENLTTFNRVNKDDLFCIYLSGYHNSTKQNFLKLIYENNKNKKYYHFGDIDPDGFLILENLKRKTGIPFSEYKMTVTELQNYSTYTKSLEKNDITKATGLISQGLYLNTMKYMLENNCKLEQEIISWMEYKK
ncbi:Wadjet anti-phage system protein JetD domain-containing protein [Treponema sp.]|uniref:Wadjet anti-phage system protein JetD domain-containing protein n=1 Tax=Treponema sp. TaxID=166 RepID=UPI0025FF3C11|nr:Wadjet anti-phage system protein JetD domain-containing protein [Treponema sp.]MCR5218500.1 DUF2220 domain-containing protein [Treponema sp.]